MSSRLAPALLLGVLAASLEAALLALRRFHPFDENVVECVALLLAAGALYLIAAWLVLRLAQPAPAATTVILLAALAFRLTLFPLPPSLSPDLHRYQWDGQVQLAGHNPYLVAPEAGTRMPGAGWPAGYGPLAELLFYGAAQLDGPTAFKLLSLLCDLGSLLVLLALLRAQKLPSERVLLYAWCPLVVVEFAGSGHNDAMVAFALLLANLAIIKAWRGVSIGALAAGAMIKWFPALLLPVFLRRSGWRYLAWFVAVCILVTLPYGDAGRHLLTSTILYAQKVRNNPSLFSLLASATGETIALGMAAALLAALSLWLARRRAEPLRATYLQLAALLLLSVTVHPWYVTWLAPFLCFFPNPAFLLWTSTVLLSYHVLIDYNTLGVWHFDPWLTWLEYLPVYGLLLWRGWRRYRGGG
ncbi:MAG TPA: glycosyltransferase 87 family protein [Candidatus Xenobia bacterium]|nr:glycosyltransferase 87 family protein [Candidatus Xenobia bacterium]